MMLNGFDSIASFYDPLARLFFGRTIIESQITFLSEIPAGKVLILGGGTGWILTRLRQLQPTAEIWYIDASDKMIRKARRRADHTSNVHFIHGTEEDIPRGITFNSVITPFYLDMFRSESLDVVINKISHALLSNSTWLVTDFVDSGKTWQRTMLWIMYQFFRRIAEIDASRLPDWNNSLRKHGWVKRQSKMYYGRFIESTIFQKNALDC